MCLCVVTWICNTLILSLQFPQFAYSKDFENLKKTHLYCVIPQNNNLKSTVCCFCVQYYEIMLKDIIHRGFCTGRM